MDKSAVNWDYKGRAEKHASQKDYASGFGGKFGVQADRQDKCAVGWDHIEKVDKHESQKDYSKGFGGKFGVQSDRQDKSAVGWDHHEAPQKHESQLDHKVGFGGKFGVQTDRMDKSAVAFGEQAQQVGTNYEKIKPQIGTTKSSDLRAKFENLATAEPVQTPLRKEVGRLPKESVQFNQRVEEPSGEQVQSAVTQSELIASKVEEITNKMDHIISQADQDVQQVVQEDEIVDTGLRATALYDYQAGAEDEISFDPDDEITHVETIDEGWWRGMCKGKYGLFPANYVQLIE